MAERENMAGEGGVEGGSGASGTAIAEKPDVVVAPQPPKKDFFRKFFGEGQEQPEVLVEPGTYRPPQAIQEPPDDNEPQQPDQGATQGTDEEEEPTTAQAADGGLPPTGNNEGDGGDREPPIDRGPEWETSPERGRWLVEQIVEMRTSMSYEERYRGENGRRLRGLYDSLQEYVWEICKIRNEPDPFGPHKAYPRPAQRQPGQPIIPPEFAPLPEAMQQMRESVQQFLDQYQLEGIEEAEELEGFPVEPLPDIIANLNRSINNRRAQYANPNSPTEFQDAQADLQIYFKQAKNHGLLEEVDAVLDSVHQEIVLVAGRGASPSQIQDMVDQRIARARRVAQVEFQEKSLADPTIPQELSGVGDAYIDWASRRIERSLNRQPQPDHREGEWPVPTPEQASRNKRETFWELGHYPKLYVVTAKTPEQFLIAKETFFQMIRSGSIGKSPTAIFEHVKNFIEFYSSEGGRQVGEGNITNDFLIENRLELEALLYVFVANYSSEVYNPKQKKEAMTAMSLDEGPARWAALYRAGKGKIAVFSHIFDEELLMDMYMNPVGERGEFDITAGHFLQDGIQEAVIERGMGIVLKDYDPRDEYFSSDDLQAKIDAALDLERIKSDLEKLKEGVRNGRVELPEDLKELKLKEGVIKLRKGKIELIEGLGPESLLSERDQTRLNALRANSYRLGLTKSHEEFKWLYESFDKGDYHIKNYQRFAEDQGQPEDQRQYPALAQLPVSIRRSIDLGRVQVELQELRQAIAKGEIRLESGKKATDYLSPRNRQIYKAAFDEASANFDIAFQMQGVLGEKARRGRGFLYVERNPHIQYYQNVGDRLRLQWIDPPNNTKVINIDGLDVSGIEKVRSSLPEADIRSFEIGWMLYKIRDGKDLNTFPQAWQDLYAGLEPREREVFVDNIPTYQAENFVQWGVFWTKMKYANEKAPIRREKVREARTRLIEELRTRGYSARLLDEPGPDRQPKLMTFKRPTGEINPETGKWEATKGAQGNVIVEDAIATFQIAAQSSDFRNRYTDHTYWYYQGNNRATIVAPHIVEAAERIRDGVSRPEDEDILATQLIIVDPTLRRVKQFEDVWQEREVTLLAAAVLESFQDKQRTKHALYKAFLPKDGYIGRMRAMGFRNEDWAGMDRFTFGFVEFAAQQTRRFARREAAIIAETPLEHDAAGPRWGVHGVSGAIKVMADEIKKITKQGIVGQFGLTKIFEVQDKAVEMYNHLVGYVDPQTGEWVFGLYEKPTDNNETMHEYTQQAIDRKLITSPTATIPFLYKLKECFGRLQKVTHDMRVMYSATDNSAGALNLEEVEIFLTDGSFNTAIESDQDILKNNGTARNRQNAFLDGEEGVGEGYYAWVQDGRPGGGADVYRGNRYWNRFLNAEYKLFDGENGIIEAGKIREWLKDKII